MIIPQLSQSRLISGAVTRLPLADPVKRLRVLRLSVTGRCNFRCCYCMPARENKPSQPNFELSLQELFANTRWVVQHTSIDRVRLTGGEPLARSHIAELIRDLVALPQLREVSLTTNGAMLGKLAGELKGAGLTRVNVSLDSMNPQRFSHITRGGCLEQTLRGIETAREAGFRPIKLNTVLCRSTWKEEVYALLDYAASNHLELRFIELMRTGTERAWCESEYVSVDEVLAWLLHRTVVEPIAPSSNAPARNTRVLWRGHDLTVGWISPRSNPFCAACERLRMDAYGQIRRCLMDPVTLNLPALRLQHNNAELLHVFAQYIQQKRPPQRMDTELAMRQIGG